MTDLAWMRPKLAELCGFGTGDISLYEKTTGQIVDILSDDWRPDEDLVQSIRCLEAMRDTKQASYEIHRAHRWRVEISGYAACYGNITAELLPKAIVLAIAASLNWKEEGET